MKIIHSTYGIKRALSILKEGIRAPRSQAEKFNTPCSFTDKVFFVVLPDFSRDTAWGDYNFVLGEDYFSRFRNQFRVHEEDSFDDFYEFVKRFGIKPYEGNHCLPAIHQILSLKPISLDGLERLITPKKLTPEEEKAIREIMPEHMELDIS